MIYESITSVASFFSVKNHIEIAPAIINKMINQIITRCFLDTYHTSFFQQNGSILQYWAQSLFKNCARFLNTIKKFLKASGLNSNPFQMLLIMVEGVIFYFALRTFKNPAKTSQTKPKIRKISIQNVLCSQMIRTVSKSSLPPFTKPFCTSSFMKSGFQN